MVIQIAGSSTTECGGHPSVHSQRIARQTTNIPKKAKHNTTTPATENNNTFLLRPLKQKLGLLPTRLPPAPSRLAISPNTSWTTRSTGSGSSRSSQHALPAGQKKPKSSNPALLGFVGITSRNSVSALRAALLGHAFRLRRPRCCALQLRRHKVRRIWCLSRRCSLWRRANSDFRCVESLL